MNNRHKINKEFLSASINEVRRFLQCKTDASGPGKAESDTDAVAEIRKKAGDAVFSLDALCRVFGLSDFERNILLLCAAMEVEGDFGKMCATIHNDEKKAYPTFNLALASLPHAHWSAVTPEAPLRYWSLVKLEDTGALAHSPVFINEFALHYIMGAPQMDAKLRKFVEPVNEHGPLVLSQEKTAGEIFKMIEICETDKETIPVIQLCGNDISAKNEIAARVSSKLGLSSWRTYSDILPETPGDREIFSRLWAREAVLNNRMLVVEYRREQGVESAKSALVRRMMGQLYGIIIICSQEPVRLRNRRTVVFDVNKPLPPEQKSIWKSVLKDDYACDDADIEFLVSQFDLEASVIRNSWTDAKSRMKNDDADNTGSDGKICSAIWDSCRKQARPGLDDLAVRNNSRISWDDLVLPKFQVGILKEMALHVKHRAKVYEKWGFGEKGKRGLGISALFSGQSGTGKTMAAEVLANELNLDLYRIDLSAVVSKYIGETEKHLKRIFDAAEAGGAILLFDEADAIFGKRSEVNDSHDRHANIEISYLLQKMESYRGLAVLTTNMKQALDSAFLRRIRFIADFPFPDSAMRQDIWERVFPRETPINGIDFAKLSNLSVTGGNIKNIALNAAFSAAGDDSPVSMGHLLKASRSEYAKMEKSLTDGEIRGWI